ncbi:hypothetical protein [Parablautia muri]|nr:hypothetical protein [Parablautia muri]
MKGKLVKISKPLLTACMALGILVGYDIASMIFFGEYEYPTEQ